MNLAENKFTECKKKNYSLDNKCLLYFWKGEMHDCYVKKRASVEKQSNLTPNLKNLQKKINASFRRIDQCKIN